MIANGCDDTLLLDIAFSSLEQQMTYVKQLEQYEDAVMRKRLDEMTEEEMDALVKYEALLSMHPWTLIQLFYCS